MKSRAPGSVSADSGAIFRALSWGRWRLLVHAMAARAGGVVAGCAAVIALDQLGIASRPVLLALGAAVGLAWIAILLRRLSGLVVAARLDHAGRTHDTLRTAVWLMSRSPSSPWIDHQLDRAARVAERLPPLPLPTTRLAIIVMAVLALGVSLSVAPSGGFGARGPGRLAKASHLEQPGDSGVRGQEPGASPEDAAGDTGEIETLTPEREDRLGDTAGEAFADGLAGELRASADLREATEVADDDGLGERLREPGSDQADAAAADDSVTGTAPGQMLAATQTEASPETVDEAGFSLPGQEFRWAEAALAEKPPAEPGAQATSGDTSGAGEAGDPQLGDPTQLDVERELERLDTQERSDDEEVEKIERASRAGPSRRDFRGTALVGAGEPPRPIRWAPVSWEDRRRIGEFFERETDERER